MGKSFEELKLSKSLLKALEEIGFSVPTPVQELAIPVIQSGVNVVGIAQTGTGKTAAYLLPLLTRLVKAEGPEPRCLVLVPTRELSVQAGEDIAELTAYSDLRHAAVYGGVGWTKQAALLEPGVDVLVATPGRLWDLYQANAVALKKVKVLVIDEADRMLDMGFMHQLRQLFEILPPRRQNLLFSATFSEKVEKMAEEFLDHFERVEVAPSATPVEEVKQILYRVPNVQTKLNLIAYLLRDEAVFHRVNPVTMVGLSATVGNPKTVSEWLKPDNPARIVKDPSKRPFQYKVFCGSEQVIGEVLSKYVGRKILIFVHSRKDAERYYNLLKKVLKLKNIYVHHSSIDRDRREESEEKFKYLKDGFMISTSTLELGIDIGDIDIVVQIRPPHNVSSFLQRIGRSGRRSKNQRSIIFYKNDPQIFITLAEIILINERHIEDLKIPEKPKDIYFHQILSSIFENGKIQQGTLFNNLKDSYAFSKMTKEDFKAIIETMEELEFVHNNSGYLSLGYNFEKKFGKRNFMDFYSVFCPNFEYTVREGMKNIGSLDSFFVVNFLKPGSQFILGGAPWKVRDIDYKRFNVKVEKDKAKKGDVPDWTSEGGVIDSLISRKIYEILLGRYDPDFLRTFDEFAKKTINEYVEHAREVGFREGIIPVEIDEKEHRIYIYTFAGMRANALLSSIFSMDYDIHSVMDTAYFSSFKFRGEMDFDNISQVIYNVEETLKMPEINSLIDEKTKKFVKNKFINFLPYEDNVKLKMELLYSPEDLIKIVKENSVSLVGNSRFRLWR